MALSLLSGSDNWWTITSLTWFTCMGVLYVVFAISTIWYEIGTCLRITSMEYERNDKGAIVDAKPDPNVSSFFYKIKKVIALRQINYWSGTRKVTEYHVSDSVMEKESDDNVPSGLMSLYSKLTWANFTEKISSFECLGLFNKIEGDGRRVYSYIDSLEKRDFITRYNWGLEKVFCRPKDVAFAAVLGGRGRLLRSQAKSSFAFSIIINLLIMLIFIGLMVWLLGQYVAYVWFVIPMYLIAAFPYLLSVIHNFRLSNNITDSQNRRKSSDESVTVTEVRKIYRVTELTERGALFLFVMQVIFLYIWPILNLFTLGNTGVGWLFVVIGLIVLVRHSFDPAIVLEENGKLQEIVPFIRHDEMRAWRSESRINEIVSKITRAGSKVGY